MAVLGRIGSARASRQPITVYSNAAAELLRVYIVQIDATRTMMSLLEGNGSPYGQTECVEVWATLCTAALEISD
jgi:hypothetical protein